MTLASPYFNTGRAEICRHFFSAALPILLDKNLQFGNQSVVSAVSVF